MLVWQGKVSLVAESQSVVVCAKCPVNFGNVDFELDLVVFR